MIGQQQFYSTPYYQQPSNPQTVQNGGFVSVRTMQEIETYPVAPGNVVTFKVENQPIIIEKTQGFSQFEAPRYKRWRMMEEEQPVEQPDFALRTDIERLEQEIEAIRAQLPKKRPAKKEEEEE